MYAYTVVPFGAGFGQAADSEALTVQTIIILQTPALILINPQLFGLAPSGLLCSRMAHLGEEEFGTPRLTELMQLILVPSVTSTATEYMFLMD